jgi:bile acid:Na+ symporter, BASS family
MTPHLLSLHRFLSRHMLWMLLGAMLGGWYWGAALQGLRSWIPLVFGLMTLATSLRCSWRELGRILRRPGLLMGLLAIMHVLVPAIGLSIGRLVLPDRPDLLAGIVLMGALPVGVTAVIWTGLAKGNIALALAAITTDMLLCPLVTRE